ncbi:hypothetical protein CMV_023110 [Castanea mollissima]|uniref:S-locus glycoprotein domain-containing protein n=1 Tax=Castanea mollissima TaxID=60419 RepID=A0A8J4QTW2_9ROSI|nr:hypothetical protein CMV_023110 [Castanea mollissima]
MDTETMAMPLILIVLFFPFCTSVDTLTPDQSIKDGQSLISNKNNFALGFFSPDNSSYRFLTSWRSQDDPGTGDYFYKMNPTGSPQVVLYRGSTLYWRTGPWPWHTSSSAAASSLGLKYYTVNNEDEVSYAYFFDDPYIISRLVLHNSGLFQLLMWNDGDLQWKEYWSTPKYRCDNYRHCGAYVLEVEKATAASLPSEVASGPARLYVNYEIWSLVIN